MNRLRLVAAFALALVWVPAPGPGQSPRFEADVAVDYVLVPVSVRSRQGYVTDLEASDFTLRVDGEVTRPASFERGAEVAASVAFLQDLSGSMALGGKLDRSRKAVECLLAEMKPGDRAAVATFAGRRLVVEVPFTPERRPVAEAMAGWSAYGVTALHDAVARLADIAPRGRVVNAAAVLLTDGVENASRLNPAESRDLVRGARTPVYVVGFSTSATEAPDGSLPRYAALLRSLAAASGGRYFGIVGEASDAALEVACAEISTEIRARYVLGFELSGEGAARYREVRVEVARKGVTISHRRGYTGRRPD